MGFFKQLLVLVVLSSLAGGGYWYYTNHMAPGVESGTPKGPRGARVVRVEAVQAEQKELSVSAEAVGTTRALRAINIVPLAEGRIVALDIPAGHEIKEGAVLARLDDEIERATVAEAEARLTERSLAMKRAQTLRQSNTISQANLEQLRSEVAIAKAELDRAQIRLAERTILAPFSGVLGMSSIDLGARVETSTVITHLDDLSEVEIEFRLPETFYGQIQQGQHISATSAAFPGRAFDGTVAAIDSRIDQASRSFRVRARLPNPERILPVGMFMRLSIELRVRNAVVVPEEALMVEGGSTFVFIAVGEKAERRPVTPGMRRAGFVELLDGVTAGELVIHHGIQSLRDNSTIELIEPQSETSGDEKSQPETVARTRPAKRG